MKKYCIILFNFIFLFSCEKERLKKVIQYDKYGNKEKIIYQDGRKKFKFIYDENEKIISKQIYKKTPPFDIIDYEVFYYREEVKYNDEGFREKLIYQDGRLFIKITYDDSGKVIEKKYIMSKGNFKKKFYIMLMERLKNKVLLIKMVS